ncbi:NUDIX domain-containing protein [Paenarthrobacter aurescens]|uniref:NUDIX domain-containing protein n=1 Tax=Paenarthrobacter aurescens TaxID=43663 RepID=UPI0035EB8021
MSNDNASADVDSGLHLAFGIPAGRTVIATVIEWRGKIALLKRSRSLGHDSGLWHCITGFLEVGVSPKQQAIDELFEETGLQAEDLLDLRPGPHLVLADGAGNPWLVHTFTVSTSQRRLRMDWEHESYRWISASKVKRFSNRVSWLDDVLTATGHLTALGPSGSIAAPASSG